MTGDSAADNLNLSGSYAVKDFNIYNTNETEESLVIENKFQNNTRFAFPESGIAPYDFVTPAVFINNEYMENQPFAFGGEDKTIVSFKTVVFAENLLFRWFGGFSRLSVSKTRVCEAEAGLGAGEFFYEG